MSSAKILFRMILILVVLFLFFVWFFTLLSRINTTGRKIMCGNTLKMIANAVKLYQADSNGQWPPSLLELGPYYEGKYNPGPNSIPKCPGDRNEEQETSSSSKYYYFPPKVGGILPVCWDSKPHRLKGAFSPDKLLLNVLYSDLHIESVEEKDFIKKIKNLSAFNPDVLEVLNDPEKKKLK